MKKIITLLFVCLFITSFTKVKAAGGPDAYGYTWRDVNDVNGPVYNWIDILPLSGAQTVRFLSDDNTVGSFPIGFPFHYYWYDVTQFWVGSNGYIGFNNGQISSPFPAIPSTAAPQNFIAAMASDLMFGSAGNIAECWRWTNAASDTLIVSYLNVPFWLNVAPGYSGSNSFQIILSAVDSSITFQYQSQTGLPFGGAGGVCSIGIENNSGNIGLQHSYNAFPTAGYAVKFYYPQVVTLAISDASTSYNDNPDTGGRFLSKNGSPFTMTTNVKNTGNQSLPAFNVFSRVLNSFSAIQAQSTVLSNALTPGQSQTITMPNTYNPTVAGTYTYVSETQYSGDLTPSNNQRIQELQVLDTTQTNIRLSYDNGQDAGLGGLNWTGGVGGAGIYFVPPFYPCKITDLHAYIVGDLNQVGYSMVVYDDNGLQTNAGTLLDSEFVNPTNVITASWNTITLGTPITITSGGVYVAWLMNGEGVTLGQNQIAPFSNRTFEILGETWAIYRFRETEDLMINISIAKTINAGINENEVSTYFSEFYPNPTSSFATINYDLPSGEKILGYELYDVQGRKVGGSNQQEMNSGKLKVDLSSIANGLYTCKINVDGNRVVKKLSVAH